MNFTWVFAGFLIGVVGMTVFLWIRAELDERRWRRKLDEARTAALIRERRYGSAKQGRL